MRPFQINADTNSQWIGLNCAGCHTAQIDYEGNSILVDGGPKPGKGLLVVT